MERFWRIQFIMVDPMGASAEGSREVFRVRYERGFCEFGLTGKYTLGLLTLIFKMLILG
jgi:hypothetical protein